MDEQRQKAHDLSVALTASYRVRLGGEYVCAAGNAWLDICDALPRESELRARILRALPPILAYGEVGCAP